MKDFFTAARTLSHAWLQWRRFRLRRWARGARSASDKSVRGSSPFGLTPVLRAHTPPRRIWPAAALERMLNFNTLPDANGQWKDSWKIFIFDDYCKDIIACLFHVADLRKHGVTLFLCGHATVLLAYIRAARAQRAHSRLADLSSRAGSP